MLPKVTTAAASRSHLYNILNKELTLFHKNKKIKQNFTSHNKHKLIK